MKYHVWSPALVAIACAASVALGAQRGTLSRPAVTEEQRFVVIGCITREAPTTAARGRGSASGPRFSITDRRTDPPTRYQLQGDAAQLDLHTGHTMEVKGPLSASAGRGAGRGATANILVMKVETMTWISSTCAK